MRMIVAAVAIGTLAGFAAATFALPQASTPVPATGDRTAAPATNPVAETAAKTVATSLTDSATRSSAALAANPPSNPTDSTGARPIRCIMPNSDGRCGGEPAIRVAAATKLIHTDPLAIPKEAPVRTDATPTATVADRPDRLESGGAAGNQAAPAVAITAPAPPSATAAAVLPESELSPAGSLTASAAVDPVDPVDASMQPIRRLAPSDPGDDARAPIAADHRRLREARSGGYDDRPEISPRRRWRPSTEFEARRWRHARHHYYRLQPYRYYRHSSRGPWRRYAHRPAYQ